MVSRPILRFGPYEVDLTQGELRRDGVRVPLQGKPLRLLAAVAERQGEVVTRAELQQFLWQGEAFGDFDNGLNTAVRKLRLALGDESDSPQYLETIPRLGYRFLAPVEIVQTEIAGPRVVWEKLTDPDRPDAGAPVEAAASLSGATKTSARGGLRKMALLMVGALVTVGAIVVWLVYGRPVFSFNARDSVLIADFENQTGDPRFDHALQTAFTVSMAQSRHLNVFPRARVPQVLALMGKPPNEPITAAVGREICQRENIRGLISVGITRTGDEYGLTAQLIDPQTGEAVRSYQERSYGEGHILEALDVMAADLRRDLGESLYQIHKDTRPLPEVTTSSLAALESYADGTLLWHQAKYQDAVTLFRAAIEADPDFAMAHAALGGAYYSFIYNESQKGDEEYQKALSLRSRTTEREWMNIQVSYADSQGHVEEAERLYQVYLQRYPDDWAMHANYARLLRRNGHAADAIAQYQQMLREAPNDARTEVEMATAYKTLGRFQDAIDAYNEGFRIDPAYLNSGDVSREYGIVLIQNGEIPKAEALFTSLLSNPKMRESGLRSLAMLDLYRGQYASARPLLEEALAIDESLKSEPVSVARERLLLGILAAGQNDAPGARQQLDSAMMNFSTLSPKVILGAWIGSEYAYDGFPQQAGKIEATITPLIDGKSPEQRAYGHLLQAEVALTHGDNQKAIQLFSLSDQEKSTPFSMEGLARAYQQSGDMTRAVSQYERYLASPDHGVLWEPQQRWLNAHYILASDYVAMGNPAQARAALNPLLALWKDADSTLPLSQKIIALNERIQ